MNFATLKGLTIPEGVVTQITDASGRVLWAVSGGTVILEVEKITANTYAGETTYTDEQFILFDIYPKTYGTVRVTYGGLTKTITDTSGAAEPNAQQVFFGTFNGVSDSVTTPASGELTIEGDCATFAVGRYAPSSKVTSMYCPCVTAIINFGKVEKIAIRAFQGGQKITTVTIPDTITSIGFGAFVSCNNLATVYVLSTTPPKLESITNSDGTVLYNTFINFKDGTEYALEKIIVPKGCGNIYKTAEGWIEYANYIVEG